MDNAQARLALADAMQLHHERVRDAANKVVLLRSQMEDAEQELEARRFALKAFVRAMEPTNDR